MQFSTTALIRFFQFIEQIESETYPETEMNIHSEITELAIQRLQSLYPLREGVKILDVGCGQGPALQHFKSVGAQAIGITLNQTDVDVCREKGFDVYKMDQSFLDFESGSFDVVWARHVIEHSVIPLYTLREFRRVLKRNAMLYLEVPGSDTDCRHAWNPNHYSVFSRNSWLALLTKAGFECVDGREYNFEVDAGKDAYWGYYCRPREDHVPAEKMVDVNLQPFYSNFNNTNLSQPVTAAPEHHVPIEELEYLADCINQGRLDEAESIAQSQTERSPAEGMSWKLYGVLLKLQGRAVEALIAMQKAVALLPLDASVHSNVGVCLNDLGRLDEAEASLRRALTIEPAYLQAHNNLGIALKGLGRMDEAKASYLQALKLDPDFAEAYCNLGVVLKDLGQLQDAETSYRHALELRPDYSDAHNNLALLLNGQGHSTAALQTIMQSLRIRETVDTKNIFVECVKKLNYVSDPDELQPYLVRALTEPWGRPIELVHTCTVVLKLDRYISTIVSRAVTAWPSRLPASELFENGTLATLSKNRLLSALLGSVPICDLELERFLTLARTVLLENASKARLAADHEDSELEFYVALANQCFINEYVFLCPEAESNSAGKLRDSINVALNNNDRIPVIILLAVAAYYPLHSLPGADRLLSIQWPDVVADVLRLQLLEPLEEFHERDKIQQLTTIENDVSRLVQGQYESNPYPRWVKAPSAGNSMTIVLFLHQKFPLVDLRRQELSSTAEILVAGCGTGQHPIGTAQRFRNARVLAVDLSVSSLCYAKRKTREMGITSIDYAQADILKLDAIGRTFDLIESCGVLHHLADTWHGWQILVSLLRPGGFMKLGFYSRIARRNITQIRKYIAEKSYGATVADIREYRQELLKNANKPDVDSVVKTSDFFSTSSCRDLLFHVQEHCLSLLEIDLFLKNNNLIFLGFEIDEQVRAAYIRRFPADPAATDLVQWHAFENDNPDTFFGMYQFWIQKA